MNTNKKTVIVTGGAGFLGSHLVPALLEKDFVVHVVDNLVAGKKEHIPQGAQFHLIDIRDKKALEALFTSLGPIYGVFHLAALPRVQFSIDNPEQAHEVNVDGMINVMNAARNAKARRVVYSASSSAYGDQEQLPLREDMLPKPMSPYALHKHYGEGLVNIYAMHYGLPGVSLRYFNIYGPNADPQGAYAQAIIKFIDQRSNGQPMTVTGDGLQTRDSVHARDVVRANIAALESESVGKGEVINIGSGKQFSVLEVAKMIGGEITFIAPRIEPRHTQADVSKAAQLLGWKPEIALADGIAELKKLYGIE